MQDIEEKVREAVRHFWRTRLKQAKAQGGRTGIRDHGDRAAVTGGAQMDGFVNLVRDILCEGGIEEPTIFCNSRVELPGYFRPEKKWDLLVVANGRLLATIEFKSQVGPSFGNNFNNRTEEAIGSAADYHTAYREGVFAPSAKPWLGYLMLLEDIEASRLPVAVREPHFEVLDEFRGASYAKRYEVLLTRLVRERLYDATCFLMSSKEAVDSGEFHEPLEELSFKNFAASLLAKAIAYRKTGR